ANGVPRSKGRCNTQLRRQHRALVGPRRHGANYRCRCGRRRSLWWPDDRSYQDRGASDCYRRASTQCGPAAEAPQEAEATQVTHASSRPLTEIIDDVARSRATLIDAWEATALIESFGY